MLVNTDRKFWTRRWKSLTKYENLKFWKKTFAHAWFSILFVFNTNDSPACDARWTCWKTMSLPLENLHKKKWKIWKNVNINRIENQARRISLSKDWDFQILLMISKDVCMVFYACSAKWWFGSDVGRRFASTTLKIKHGESVFPKIEIFTFC